MAKSDLALLDVASDALFKDLRTVLTTPLELLRSLADNLERDRGFRLRDEERFIKLWTSAGLAAAELSDTHAVLKHLFEHGITSDKPPDTLLEEIKTLCSAKDIPGFDERREVLGILLTPSERYLERRSVVPWTRNALVNLVGLDSSAELRAAFRSSSSDELLGLIPMATLRIATKHDDDEDSQVRRIAMQLTEEDIDELTSTLQLLKQRLSALRHSMKGSHVRVYDEVVRGQWKTPRHD